MEGYPNGRESHRPQGLRLLTHPEKFQRVQESFKPLNANEDDLAISNQGDGFVKSSRCKARKN